MCLFPQAFRLIFCLEFFRKYRAACSVQGLGSVLMAKIKVLSQPLQIITIPPAPNLFPFYKIFKFLGNFNRNMKHASVILVSLYPKYMCDIPLERGCSSCGTMSRTDVTVMIS